jgi:hypothetical protein
LLLDQQSLFQLFIRVKRRLKRAQVFHKVWIGETPGTFAA